MISLRIEGGGERQHVRGTKLHAETASFAALYDDGNASFSHLIPQLGSTITPGVRRRRRL
jgi:hypothetical protein